MATLSTLQISGSGTYVQITDHASAPSPTANKLYANSTSVYWEDTDLAAGGGDAMDKVKSQGPTTDGSATTTGLANTAVLMASGANTAINILFNQGTALAGAYNTTIHVAGDVNMPGLAITSDGTNGSQTFNDLSLTDHTITATADVHHDSGGSVSLRMAGAGFGSGTDTAYNDTAIYFDGSGDALTLPDHALWDACSLESGTTGWTMEAWIYMADTTDRHTIFQQYVDSDNYFVFLVGTSGSIDLYALHAGAYIFGNKNGFNAGVGQVMVNNTWNHVAAVRNGNEWQVYTNGVPAEEGPEPQYGYGTFAATPHIGKGSSSSTWDTTGYMDNIRIYPYAKYTEEFSQQLPILARALTSNRAGEFTVRGNALWVGGGDDVSLADTGVVNRTGDDTTGDGLISVVIDSPQTVNSTAFMVPVIFKNTSDVQLTLNYNMWASVRANTATSSSETTRMTHYGNRGLWAGGLPTYSDVIDYFTIGTVSETATDFGNLTAAKNATSALSNGARGIIAAGRTSPATGGINNIDYITISSAGDAADFGDVNSVAHVRSGNKSDGNRGVISGGFTGSAQINVIEFITIGTTGNATDFGDQVSGIGKSQGGASNGSRGMTVAGSAPGSPSPGGEVNVIEYITIGTIGNSTDFGDSAERVELMGTVDDGSRCVYGGGAKQPATNSDEVYYFNIASLGNSTDFAGELTQARMYLAACSNGSRGCWGGGQTSDPTAVNVVDYIPIGTLATDAVDFGELSVARQYVSSFSGD